LVTFCFFKTQAGLQLMILLSPLCWDYRHALPRPS
jgi:hypothetical protein